MMKKTESLLKNKKILFWMGGILTIILTLIIIIRVRESVEAEYVPRAQACKAVALAMTDRPGCEKTSKEHPHFPEKERDEWYVKYMDQLYEAGLLQEDLTPPTKEGVQGYLTYEEAGKLVRAVDASLGEQIVVTKWNRKKYIHQEQWWLIYEAMIPILDPDGLMSRQSVLLYGTPANVDGAKEWMAYTSLGNLKFEGLSLDAYIDTEIQILKRGTEIVRMEKMISDQVTYENVWLMEDGNDTFCFEIGSMKKSFPVTKKMKKEEIVNQLADVELEQGKLKKVTLKKDTIQGKVLAVNDTAIEIEGYGAVPLANNFKVYKLYGTFAIQGLEDILVGYDMQDFVVADGKLCAALTKREFDAKTIRVLLMDTNFKSEYHSSVTIQPQTDVILTIDGDSKEKKISAGETLEITPENELFEKGRILLTPEPKDGEIAIPSIQRSIGTPSYGGRLELIKTDKGIVIINDLYMEDYLKKVVPSEMPATYEKEALKAQAVCARSYAYKQIQTNSYYEYGAHVNDSTEFQVYNNALQSERSDAAVNETYGKMLCVNGVVQTAFYFSTSCGHTTDGTIWGASLEEVPYLHGVLLKNGDQKLDLTSNAAFEQFIKDTSYSTYESGFSLYRWRMKLTSTKLESVIPGIGTITDLVMVERGTGGIGEKLKVVGTKGEYMITGQGQIRTMLADPTQTIVRADGSYLRNSTTLPSAFIHIDNLGSENGVTTFRIWGGGYGHGVGMSQNGAQGMAKAGKTYEEILHKFYTDVEIREVK